MSVGESKPMSLPKEIARLLGPDAHELDVPRSRRVFVNRNLRMDEIDLVGFDMDYTLAIYNQASIERLSIECTLRKMVEKHRYSSAILGLDYDPAWAIRGLVVDRRQGNLLKMDRYGHVGRVYHGRRPVAKPERHALYRGEQRIRLSSSRYAWIDTLFALPEAVMYTRLIDYFEDQKQPLRFTRLWQDIRECIDEAHRDESMKTIIKANPGAYLVRDPELAPTLHKYRSSGKRLFLLTNSLWDYTDHVMRFLLDNALSAYPSWRSYFDIIVVAAQKPAFFTERAPFSEIDASGHPLRQFREGQLLRGRIYECGNLYDLERMAGAGGDHVLYIGDHIYGDMLRSKKSSNWRTAMIIQELESEIQMQDRRAAEIARLEELERRLPTLDSEINYAQLVLKSLARLSDSASGEPKIDPRQVETAKRAAKANLDHLRAELRDTLDEYGTLHQEIDRAFNPYWGPLFKEGPENSRFGEQVEDYACVYTSRVSNFLSYSPLQYFRGPRDHMPHEFA
ncbi:MAG TPA: HAD-IG family 5'-nucleotidase [Polyangia bacterium]|nr:HAD-IG family 5'-nucleotidase [Polyangia bacterium]